MTSFTRLALLLVLLASGCTDDEAHHHGRSHRHADRPPLPAELPTLGSHALEHSPHRTFERAPPAFLPRVSGPRRIAQKVLLLSATGEDPSFLAARAALDRIGIPYEPVIALQREITAALLTDDVATCHFNSVIFSTSGLGYADPVMGWQSALSAEEWARLVDFELACGAREAIWYAWPSPDLGLSFVSSFDWLEPVDGVLRTPGFFGRVRADARIPYRHAYGYRAAIVDPTTTTALVEDASGGVLLALHRAADGREVMVSTVDSSPYLTHALVLEYDMLRWLTRGMFVGEKRAYLAPQVDDLFLENDMWVAGEGNLGTTQLRIDGADLEAFVAWQAGLQARLPAGSAFVTEMAFNGVGSLTSEYADTSLLAAARAAGSRLTWLNHTWDHENMDLMTRAEARAEVAKNCQLARNLKLAGFTCTDLVTPEVSGLRNLAAVRGILDAGARYTVSDTSVTEAIRPDSPGTNPSFNVGRTNPLDARLYQVPRHPTNIFYDVATPATAIDEYNAVYRSYYGRDLAYDELIDKDSEFGLFYLLQGDIDPLMFHQANIANYGGGRSVYGDWIEAATRKFVALMTTPVLTLPQTKIGQAMQARGQLDACGLSATVVETTTGRHLELRSTRACRVPVTGLLAGGYGAVETYAGEPITSIAMPAQTTKVIPLL